MSSGTARTHHYIPAFYLRQWAGTDKHVCEYRKVYRGKVVTRRCVPESTGYEKDLYRVDAPSDVISPEIESTFMKTIDNKANLALQELLQGDDLADQQKRADWTRFLLSLRFRNPEGVKLIKSQMMAAQEGCPEYMSPEAAQKAALNVLMRLINNDDVGPIIHGMNWRVVSLKRSEISLLTSDRPLAMPHELANENAYIALPLGPALLFIAEHDERFVAAASIDATATRLVKDRNQFVVEAAHEFVWGLDDSQLRFVRNRMSRWQAIDVALASGAEGSIGAAG